MFCRLPILAALAATLILHGFDGFSAEITAERSEKGAVVKIDGQLFTEYLVRSGTKPIIWPIIGPTGKPMTRDFPMRDRPGETKDHIPASIIVVFATAASMALIFGRNRGKGARSNT